MVSTPKGQSVWETWWMVVLALPLAQLCGVWAYASLKKHPVARLWEVIVSLPVIVLGTIFWLGFWVLVYRAGCWIFAHF
jgi:ABC-type phosphate transport system permease subunit